MMSRMSTVFRADASLQMGTGHVMRCLTLADAIKAQGAECHFICREHPGNLIEHIKSKGYSVHILAWMSPAGVNSFAKQDAENTEEPAHATWLGATQEQDVDVCAKILHELQPDWLIVDHYALDAFWERALQPYYRKLMVIDDLADRSHLCDLLLDQNLGRQARDYNNLVPAHCQIFAGASYALLRPEFAALRSYSLKRRAESQIKRLLITMGGVDRSNATGLVLVALQGCPLPADCRITVVMGAAAPWLDQVRSQAALMYWPTEVLVNISEMARHMADSDLAIGAAGSTSWERCCLGLPSVVVCLAKNQLKVIGELEKERVALALDIQTLKNDGASALWSRFVCLEKELPNFIAAAAGVTNGQGAQKVAHQLKEWDENEKYHIDRC